MVSQHIIDIIIKAEDRVTETAKKVEDSMKKVSSTSTVGMDAATKSSEKFGDALKKTSPTIQDVQNKVSNMGKNGVTSFNQLSAAEQKVLNKFLEIKPTVDSAASKISEIGVKGASSFNQLSVAQQKALVELSAMTAKTSSSTSEMVSKWDKVKNKVSDVGNSIKTKIGEGIDSTKTKIEELNTKLGSIGQAFVSAFGLLGLGSLTQATIGLAMTRERMTTLTSATMGSSAAAKEFVGYLDHMTDNSLVSLNDLGQAMNTIKIATGMNNEQLKKMAPLINDVGQRAILMGKDSTEAMSIMQAAGRGLNGEFDILKSQFGITKNMLMEMGWSGAADDVEGYTEALEKALERGGSMEEMMKTTEGRIALVKKGFSSAAREIGEVVLPVIQAFLEFMVKLKEKYPGVYKFVIIFGLFSTLFATMLPHIITVVDAFIKLKKAISAVNLTMLTNPITIIILAVIALITVIWYLYNNCESFREAVDWLWEQLKEFAGWLYSGLIVAWEAVIEALQPVVSFFTDILGPALYGIFQLLSGENHFAVLLFQESWENLMSALGPVGDFIESVFGPIIQWLFGIIAGSGESPVDALRQSFLNLMDALGPVGDFIIEIFGPAFDFLFQIIDTVWESVMNLIEVFDQLMEGQITLQEALGEIWTIISEMFAQVLMLIIQGVIEFSSNLFRKALEAGANFVNGIIQHISQLPGRVANWISQTTSRIISGAVQWVSNARQKAKETVDGVMSHIRQLPGLVYQEFMNIGNRILSAGSSLVEKAKQVGRNIVNGLKDAMGMRSPGYIQRAVVAEFENMLTRVGNKTNEAYNVAKGVGEGFVNGFNTENLNSALDVTPSISPVLDQSPVMNASVETDVNSDDDYSLMNEGLSENYDLMIGTTQSAYDTMQSAEMTSMSQMQNHIASSMNNILMTTGTALGQTTVTTNSNLQNMQNSTARVTQNMVKAWDTMKTSIISAADKIKSESTTHFKKLSDTIGSFYRKLQNPRGWGAGPSGSRSISTGGRSMGMSKITNAIAQRQNGPRTITISNIRRNPCIDNGCIEYIQGKGSNIKTNDLIRGGCLECALGIDEIDNKGAGWLGTVPNNVSHIKNTAREWNMKGPVIADKYPTSISFKVKEFENGAPNISFQSFKGIAEDLFSQIPYAFYWDSEKYGSWVNALYAGEMNCSDGADTIVALAHASGLSASKVHGHWNNVGHFWAEVEGHKMDTTGFQKYGNWNPPQSHAGPVRHDPFKEQNNILEGIAQDVETGEKFDVETGETVSNELIISGDATITHKFIDLPESVDEAEVVRLLKESVNDKQFIKLLVNNSEFQNQDNKAKTRIKRFNRRSIGV